MLGTILSHCQIHYPASNEADKQTQEYGVRKTSKILSIKFALKQRDQARFYCIYVRILPTFFCSNVL